MLFVFAYVNKDNKRSELKKVLIIKQSVELRNRLMYLQIKTNENYIKQKNRS